MNKKKKREVKYFQHPGCHASCCIPPPEVEICADGTLASSWNRQGATYERESQT